MRRQGLVLGAGGALGAAWMVGTLSALQELENFDPAAFEVMVGTSAGSVLASMLAVGTGIDELTAQIDVDSEPKVEGTGPVNAFDVHRSMGRMPRPTPLPSNLRLAARGLMHARRTPLMTVAAGLAPRGRGDLHPLADLVRAVQAGRPWPTQPRLRIVAMSYESGRRVVFGDPDEDPVPLPSAVIASCAAPGFYPPVEIDARRYVDGGAISMTNLDVLRHDGLDEVLVLAPMAGLARRPHSTPPERADRRLRAHFTRQLRAEIARLERQGTAVRLLAPSEHDLVAMGYNVMNPMRRREVLRTAREGLTAAHVPITSSMDYPPPAVSAGG